MIRVFLKNLALVVFVLFILAVDKSFATVDRWRTHIPGNKDPRR